MRRCQSQYPRRVREVRLRSRARGLTAVNASPGGDISPFCDPATATSTPQSSIRKSTVPSDATTSAISRAGWRQASRARRTATQPLLDAARVECASPVAFQLLDLGAEVARELAPGPGEHAGGGHQHEIALAEEVHERGLPGAVAVGGVKEHPALRPEHPGEVGEARIGDGHEIGVDQVDGGAVHRGEHAIGDVGRPRRHQEVAAAQEFRIAHGRWFECRHG